jgi:Mg-chelatase subunit ChlD
LRSAVVAVTASALLPASFGCVKVQPTTPGNTTGAGGAGAGVDAAPRDAIAGGDTGAVDRPTAVSDRDLTPDIRVAPDAPTGAMTDAACATQSVVAQTLPLDLYMMIDSSGSMSEPTAAGPTKWMAVQSALRAFFNDPMSAGISVGLQYFPQIQPNVPTACSTNANCGSFGPCDLYKTCFGLTTTQVVLCNANSDCKAGETCIQLGQCPLSGGSCAPIGVYCPYGDTCLPYDGYCQGRDRCDLPTYTTPAVAFAALPGAAAALGASLTARQPDGRTPTGPALSGALQAARAQAAAAPDHRVATVLVTDGLPTECAPLDIPAIAAVAASGAAGTPAVPTFVIGVFGPDEAATARPNLDALAAGGGTGNAVVIDTSQDVTKMLQAALNQIRTSAVACTFKIPPASMGAIDFNKVNVQVTPGGGTAGTIGYVKGKASCDPTRGGWYYDVDPATGQTPSTIITCDATCAQLASSATARIDIVLGCQTIVITLDERVEGSAALPRGAHRGRVREPFEGSHGNAAQRSGCSRRS